MAFSHGVNKSSLKNKPESFLLCQAKSKELEILKFFLHLFSSLWNDYNFSMLAGKPGASEKPKGVFFFLETSYNVNTF